MNVLAWTRRAARPSGVVVFAALGQAVGGVLALGLAYTWADPLREGGLGIGLLLVLVGLIGCGFALLPTHVLSLVCGWALGPPVGFAVAVLTATAAAPIGYRVGQLLAGPSILDLLRRYPRGAAVCQAITRASAWRAGLLVGLLRLSPVVPYGSTNVLAAIFRLPLSPFLIGTLIGLSPRVMLVVGLGAGLEQLDLSKPGSPWMIGAGLAATALAFLLMGWVTRQTLAQMADLDRPDPTDPSEPSRSASRIT